MLSGGGGGKRGGVGVRRKGREGRSEVVEQRGERGREWCTVGEGFKTGKQEGRDRRRGIRERMKMG